MRDPPDILAVSVQDSSAAYERFFRESHIDALTLCLYFPALVVNLAWPLLPATFPSSPAGTALGLVVTAVYLSYAVVALVLGRRSLRLVLVGRLAWKTTVLIVAIAYLFDLLYTLLHVSLHLRTNFVWSVGSALSFVYLCMLTPVTEELVFQGYVQTRLQRLGSLAAMSLTTILFVCGHFWAWKHGLQLPDIAHMFEVFFPSLFIYALVRQYTGSLAAAITVHALTNVTLLLTVARV